MRIGKTKDPKKVPERTQKKIQRKPQEQPIPAPDWIKQPAKKEQNVTT